MTSHLATLAISWNQLLACVSSMLCRTRSAPCRVSHCPLKCATSPRRSLGTALAKIHFFPPPFSLVAGCEWCDNLGGSALIIKTVIWSGALLLYLWEEHAQWSDCVETRRVLDPWHKGLYFQGIFEYQCWDMITPAAPPDDTHPHTHHTFRSSSTRTTGGP